MFQTGRGSTPAARPSPAPRVALKAWPKPAPEPWGETGPSSWPEASVPDLVPRRCQLGRKRSAVGERPNPRTALLPASWACSARLVRFRDQTGGPNMSSGHCRPTRRRSAGSGGRQLHVTRLGNGRREALGTKQASDTFLRARGVCRSPPSAPPPSGSPHHV